MIRDKNVLKKRRIYSILFVLCKGIHENHQNIILCTYIHQKRENKLNDKSFLLNSEHSNECIIFIMMGVSITIA